MTTRLLLYFAHAIDHLALLIFATAVSAIRVPMRSLKMSMISRWVMPATR